MDKFLTVCPQTGEFFVWYRIKNNWWATINCLANNVFEDWKLKDNISLSRDNYLGRRELSEAHIPDIGGYYSFDDFNIAAKNSEELWTKCFAPNALYRVARYFDTYFDEYVSSSMSKKEAHKLAYRLNISVDSLNNKHCIEYHALKQEE